MNFSSPVFVFMFLPITYFLYSLCKNIKYKNYILMIGSLLFYSASRLDWFLILMVSIVANYFMGIFVSKENSFRKIALILTIILNLSVLFVFKYMNFFTGILSNVSFLKLKQTSITLPIGISFFTFQCLSYVVDVYRDPLQRVNNISKLILYISFFPQLIAGPIIKYSDISEQIDCRKENYTCTVYGIRRFVLGLSKKMFLANTLGEVSDMVYALSLSDVNFLVAWIGAVCYMFQIYFDFSGYSDMAIGMGEMFGFKIKENFDSPYLSSSIKDFWHRWHISLSSWFRDYLYIPIGGNRLGIYRTKLNKIVVFFLTGMWHGANWTFIVWGLWHGIFLIVEDFLKNRLKIPNVVGRIYTIIIVCIGFVIFRADNIMQACNMIYSMIFRFYMSERNMIIIHNIATPSVLFYIIISVLLTLVDMKKTKIICRIKRNDIISMGITFVLFLLCILKLATGSFNPFIYTQF